MSRPPWAKSSNRSRTRSADLTAAELASEDPDAKVLIYEHNGAPQHSRQAAHGANATATPQPFGPLAPADSSALKELTEVTATGASFFPHNCLDIRSYLCSYRNWFMHTNTNGTSWMTFVAAMTCHRSARSKTVA